VKTGKVRYLGLSLAIVQAIPSWETVNNLSNSSCFCFLLLIGFCR